MDTRARLDNTCRPASWLLCLALQMRLSMAASTPPDMISSPAMVLCWPSNPAEQGEACQKALGLFMGMQRRLLCLALQMRLSMAANTPPDMISSPAMVLCWPSYPAVMRSHCDGLMCYFRHQVWQCSALQMRLSMAANTTPKMISSPAMVLCWPSNPAEQGEACQDVLGLFMGMQRRRLCLALQMRLSRAANTPPDTTPNTSCCAN